MSAEQAPGPVDSDAIVRPLLAERFELIRQGLDKPDLMRGLAEIIQARKTDAVVEVVNIVGGAGSGKTELVTRLISELESSGLAAGHITTDGYSKGNRKYRDEVYADRPYDKYDFGLLNEHVQKIVNFKDGDTPVMVPVYRGSDGMGIALPGLGDGDLKAIGKVDVIIVEGDFSGVDNPDTRLFVHMPDHQRLQNRIKRDLEQRGYPDEAPIRASFEARHTSQHLPYAVPEAERADYIVEVDAGTDEWRYDIYKAK